MGSYVLLQVGLSSDIFQPFQGQIMTSKPTCLLAGSQEKKIAYGRTARDNL